METYQVGLIALALFLLLALLALAAWRRRSAAQKLLLGSPVSIDSSNTGRSCFYVATTFADRPLERVIAHGLAHRGHARLTVTANELEVSRTGELSFLIPRADLLEVSLGSAVIDRAVEKEGLVVVKWLLGGVELQTHFRFVDSALRSATIQELRPLVGAR
jgi:hypothetical protein